MTKRDKTRAKDIDGVTWLDAAVRQLIDGIDPDPRREGLIETPARVRKAMLEMTSGYDEDPASILGKRFKSDGYSGLVLVKDIEFWSLCEHHLLPFNGTASVGYLPNNGNVVGLSKVARLVMCYAKRLQLQERMTQQIADALTTHLRPRGCGVVLRATHLCMACRGVKSPAQMVTSAFSGALAKKRELRDEFLRFEASP